MEQFPLVIQWKLFRAKQHFDEALRELGTWFSSDPGHLVPAPESTPGRPIFMYVLKEPVPARFGLIAGDFLQNLRSVLDYLVWLLVEVNGKTPKRCNAFPICATEEGYRTALGKNNRLKGVSPEAKKIIRSLQPAFLPSATPNELTILDELVNENKHRTPLVTSFVSVLKPDQPLPFRHIELQITRHRNGNLEPGERIVAFIAFESPIVSGLEVIAVMEALFDYVYKDVLPRFLGLLSCWLLVRRV